MTGDTWRPMAEPTLTWKQYEMGRSALIVLILLCIFTTNMLLLTFECSAGAVSYEVFYERYEQYKQNVLFFI